ncbi:MAG TPA: phosphoribosylanthranilate isomerase [Firmicutes bacterium]|nr:phosphoribosylanthranilate isomerase [Bacillota bacterium]
MQGTYDCQIWVKICGIADIETAQAAVRCGASAIGFVFAEKSPRRVSPETARRISNSLPRGIEKVGVFVDEDPGKVAQIAGFCGLDLVQLHGRESPEYCRALGLPVIKAFRVRDARGARDLDVEDPAEIMERYAAVTNVARFLLDTYVAGNPGGTGRSFDWAVAASLVARARRPVILAGGLTPENVARAISIARPFGVDVSSGVESNGRKDAGLIRLFLENANSGEGELPI